MTNEQAAQVMDKMLKRGWCLTEELDLALPVAIAALRQGLPKRWPLKWKNTNPKGVGAYVAALPLTTYAATVYRIHPGCWRWHLPNLAQGFCVRALSARRAAERAVARAIAESMGVGK